MKLLLTAVFLLFFGFSNAQISINTNGSKPHPSAMLDVQSYNRGVLVPRMTTFQRYAIYDPATGLLVFDTNTGTFWFYDGDAWKEIQGSKSSDDWLPHQNGIFYNAGKVGIGITPSKIIPLTIFQPNTGDGNAVLHLQSNDTWHTALTIFNGDTSSISKQKYYSFILAGPSNANAIEGTFGLFNHQSSTWGFNFNPDNNYMAVGSTSAFNSDVPRSRLHVFAGDVNIDQIGSGIIMKSPNGTCWRITINDAGNLVRTAIICP